MRLPNGEMCGRFSAEDLSKRGSGDILLSTARVMTGMNASANPRALGSERYPLGGVRLALRMH